MLVVAGVAAASWACSAGQVVPRANRYTNTVDGISAGWPTGWDRLDTPLTKWTGGAVSLLDLATFDAPQTTDLGCATYAPAATAAMGRGDAIFRLQTVRHLTPEREISRRPASFMAASEPAEFAGGCKPKGVVARRVAFEEHGRLYEAFLLARSPLGQRQRDDVETIWASLELGPIATGLDGAEAGRPYWHEISTHCGITDTNFDARAWVADPVLYDSREGPNPPAGWDNPTEVGIMELADEDTAVFTSRDGDRTARFRPRVPGDLPVVMCE